MSDRTAWDSLIKLTFEGVEMAPTRQAAAYLGVGEKHLLKLCKDFSTRPDMVWGGNNLYTRSTLDRIDHQRNQPGRPPKSSDGGES